LEERRTFFYLETLLPHYAASRKPITDNGPENTGIYKETGLGFIGLGSKRNEVFAGFWQQTKRLSGG